MDKYAAALPGCPRLGAKRMRGLIEFFHTAEDVWKASDEDIRKSHVLHGNGEAAFLAWRHETNPDAVMEKINSKPYTVLYVGRRGLPGSS